LTSAAIRPAEPASDKSEHDIEHAAPIGAHDHGGAKEDLPGRGQFGFLRCGFPGFRHVDAEAPGFGNTRFVAADDAGCFVVWRIETMGVNRRRAHLEPNARWTR
jgi:hypothetical protein